MELCQTSIRLRDYGNMKCRKPAGHDGQHVITSPYDSRDVVWRDAEAPEQPSPIKVITDTLVATGVSDPRLIAISGKIVNALEEAGYWIVSNAVSMSPSRANGEAAHVNDGAG